MALVLTIQIYAIRRAAQVRRAATGGALSGVAFTVSLAPTLLCCTPVIPTLLASAGLSTLSVYTTTGTLQQFLSTHETSFFLTSLALLAITGWWSVHRLASSACLTDACPPTRP